MEKRILSVCLTACMLLTLMPSAFAADAEQPLPIAGMEQTEETSADARTEPGDEPQEPVPTEEGKGTQEEPFTTVAAYNEAVKGDALDGKDVYLTILMYLVMFFPVKLLAKIVLIPQERLYPVVLMMCTVGAYATLNGRMFDVWCLLLFGIVGLLIKKFHFPVSCFLIGFILGGDLEDYFIQVLTAYNGSLTGLFVRPMGWVIWALIILSVVYAVLDNRKAKRQEKELSGKQ